MQWGDVVVHVFAHIELGDQGKYIDLIKKLLNMNSVPFTSCEQITVFTEIVYFNFVYMQ